MFEVWRRRHFGQEPAALQESLRCLFDFWEPLADALEDILQDVQRRAPSDHNYLLRDQLWLDFAKMKRLTLARFDAAIDLIIKIVPLALHPAEFDRAWFNWQHQQFLQCFQAYIVSSQARNLNPEDIYTINVFNHIEFLSGEQNGAMTKFLFEGVSIVMRYSNTLAGVVTNAIDWLELIKRFLYYFRDYIEIEDLHRYTHLNSSSIC